ncbi:MAG: hypothetical protein RSD14_05820 [Clostridia bacterium]
MECVECYSEDNTKRPRLGDTNCLENHKQYICGTCSRCICIEEHPERKLRRWNFPFKTYEVAKLYLRTADYATKQCCGVYEIVSKTRRKSYKIFIDDKQMKDYLKKSTDKQCTNDKALFRTDEYKEFLNTGIRKLTKQEANDYWNKRF